MNFSIHIDDTTAKKLRSVVKRRGQNKNHIIRKAIERYLESEQRQKWPDDVLALAGLDKKSPPFESLRSELATNREDPLK